MLEKYTPHSPETIEAEESLLLYIQSTYAEVMEEPMGDGEMDSIADKLRTIFDDQPLTRLQVTVGKEIGKNGQELERIWVRVAKVDLSQSGHAGTSYSYVPIAERVDAAVYPCKGFNDEEAVAVAKMADFLKAVKELGFLEHLAGNLASINDPNTAIQKLPPIRH